MSRSGDALPALLEVMARLRDPARGCPWDLAQSFATIAPYTIEEAYEVADAIDSGDAQRLRDELGDLLFQVVFHARMAEERGWFDFQDVAAAIRDKLLHRHPHVFDTDGAPGSAPRSNPGEHEHAALHRQWEEHKARERAAAALRRGAASPSTLSDVPLALPALSRAVKLGKRAARVGFDWSDAQGVRAKILEELRELDAEIAAARGDTLAEELGDLLFSVANWGRHLHVDPEEALRAANRKFEQRFRRMEQAAADRGLGLGALSAQQWDELWLESKRHDTPESGA